MSPAIVTRDGEIDRKALDLLAAREADRLRMTAGEALALIADARVETIARVLACRDRGASVVLLHPRWTRSETSLALSRLPAVRSIDERLDVPPPTEHCWPAWFGRSPGATILFTSGTRGAPRAAVLSRAALDAASRASGERLGWEQGDRWHLGLSLGHVGGLAILLRTIDADRTLILDVEPRFEAARFVRSLAAHHATLASLVPTMLADCVSEHLSPPPSLRIALVGGAPASARLVRDARALGWPVLRTYGMTETASQLATDDPREVTDPDSGIEPLRDVEPRIVDGVLEVRTPTLFSGYVGDSAGDPHLTEDGYFRTNDRATLDPEGRIHILGRADDVIVTGGEKVDPVEIEAWLEAQPGVARACVFGRPDARWGAIVTAAIVPCDPASFELASLREALTEIASYKRPRVFTLLDGLTLNAMGKLDRRATTQRALTLPAHTV